MAQESDGLGAESSYVDGNFHIFFEETFWGCHTQ